MTNPMSSPGAVPDWSLEATLPDAREIDLAREALGPGQEIFVNALPRFSHQKQLQVIRQIGRAGFTAIPHLAARSYSSLEELDAYLREASDLGVHTAFLVGGDIAAPRGPFSEAADLLETGLLVRHGIKSVGFAAYPVGHPWLKPEQELRLLKSKLSTATSAGLAPFVTTQFGFEARPTLKWLSEIRKQGIQVPVRIGIAGPVSLAKLTRITLRCQVAMPVERIGLAVDLVRGGPASGLINEITAGLSENDGPIQFHIFGFGGLERTAAWMCNHAIEMAPLI